MNLIYFCKRIGLTKSAVQTITARKLSDCEYTELKSMLSASRTDFFKKVLEKSDYKQWFLSLYCRFACDAYEEYQKRNISNNIYFHTFSDISIWCSQCKRECGEDGIMQYDWLWRHTQLCLFRLGRLQFELMQAEQDLTGGDIHVLKGQNVLNVHIPEGEPLEEKACMESFRLAASFFPWADIFVCHSWLLYPELKEILSATSNIIKFQKFFNIVKTDFEIREAEERIYHQVSDNPFEYPENTTLQKSAKNYLMQGYKLGNGFGVMHNPTRNGQGLS